MSIILPNNGKVVIIDDKISEVESLISGLSSEKVPFVYYKDELGEDLPETPLHNIRLVFLDLLLIDDNEPSVKKVISTIISRLKRIISPENGPYILIYWSTTKKKYSKSLEIELNKKSLKAYKPFEIFSLSKPSSIDKVKEELTNRFEKFKSLKAFFLLESFTNKAGGDIVNKFTRIFSVDGGWDKNLKDVLYKTGEARIGKDNFTDLTDNDKIKNSLLTISSTIHEHLEKIISECDFSEINFDKLTKYDTSSEAKAKFNSTLHLFNSIESVVKSGTIYFLRNRKNILTEIMDKLKDRDKDISKIKPKLFFIDLTATCDYAQDKNYVRGVFGVVLKADDLKFMKKPRPASCKLSPLVFLENEVKHLILDFRFSESILTNEFKKNKWKPVLKISNELLNEFQAEFAKHINRPGYTSLY